MLVNTKLDKYIKNKKPIPKKPIHLKSSQIGEKTQLYLGGQKRVLVDFSSEKNKSQKTLE